MSHWQARKNSIIVPRLVLTFAAALSFALVLGGLHSGTAVGEENSEATKTSEAAKTSETAKTSESTKTSETTTIFQATAEVAQAAKIGQKAPVFALKDTQGVEHKLDTYLAEGKIVVLEWFNPECPFVKKHHVSGKTMAGLNQKYKDKKVVWLAINSGAPGKQGYGLERNEQARKDYGISYPVLLDDSGKVGRAYGAKTTPHMFVILPDGMLAYAGGIDDDPNVGTYGKLNYVDRALEQCLSQQKVAIGEAKSYGCSVKYSS